MTTLRYRGSDLATLLHRRGLLDSPEAMDDLVSAVHLGLANERLHAETLDQTCRPARVGGAHRVRQR